MTFLYLCVLLCLLNGIFCCRLVSGAPRNVLSKVHIDTASSGGMGEGGKVGLH